VLKNWRAAARRRDILLSRFCDDLRSENMTVTGFLVTTCNARISKSQQPGGPTLCSRVSGGKTSYDRSKGHRAGRLIFEA